MSPARMSRRRRQSADHLSPAPKNTLLFASIVPLLLDPVVVVVAIRFAPRSILAVYPLAHQTPRGGDELLVMAAVVMAAVGTVAASVVAADVIAAAVLVVGGAIIDVGHLSFRAATL
jgi:hypothetical protein